MASEQQWIEDLLNAQVAAEREQIEKEITDHLKWCCGKCSTFLPEEYRKRRLSGSTAKSLQKDYDSCHIWR